MYRVWNFILFLLLCFAYGNCDFDPLDEILNTHPRQIWNETNMDKLKKTLFMNYDKNSRPDEHYNTTEVSIGLAIIHLETNELKSTLTTHVWVRMIWHDNKLKWDTSSDYEKIQLLRIADHEVWQPDIYLYNSPSGGEPIFRFVNHNVLIYPTGEILWVPAVKLTSFCEYNLRHWPFDTQHCELKLGSWTHNGNEIDLKLYNNKEFLDLSELFTGIEWNITNTTSRIVTKFHSCCKEPYYFYQSTLTMVRKSETYRPLIVPPAVVNSVLILLQFWLPPHSKEKIILNSFIFIILASFLMYLASKITIAGSNTPLIVLFYSCNFILLFLAVFINAITYSITKSKRLEFLSKAVITYTRGSWAKCLVIDQFARLHTSNEEVDGATRGIPTKYVPEDWFLTLVVNRILFSIYCLIYLIVACIYLF